MIDNKFQRIWKDPVWSKVISFIIVAIGTIIYNFVVSKTQDTSFRTSFFNFWEMQIQFWIVTILFLIYLILRWTIRNFTKRKNDNSFIYDEKTLALDTQLFNRIRNELLPQEGTIYWLRHNNFAGQSFKDENLNQLDKIEWESQKSDFEFLNPELERIKLDLLKEIDTFTSSMVGNTFPTVNGRQTVPPEWELEQPERFWKVVNDIHSNSRRICDKYDQLIRTGRRLLKV